jgi:hypothetical protein
MPPKRFEGKFGIPASHPVESLLTQALYRLPETVNVEKIESLTQTLVDKVNVLRTQENLQPLTESEQQTLALKLARHYEDNGEAATIDIPTCVDALAESPRYLQSDKGSIAKLFDLHEMKTLQKIAELRRKRIEIDRKPYGEMNPYENLFETNNGKYYLARLINMPHLREESEYMEHCVGTSTSYINKMKKGDVEIFSFRDMTTDQPVVTIEYDTRSHELLQVKAQSDRIPTLADDFAPDLIEAIELLGGTVNDQGDQRVVLSTEAGDLRILLSLKQKVQRHTPFTKDDLAFLYEIDTPIHGFELDEREPLIAELLKDRNIEQDIPVIFDCAPEDIAHSIKEITENTKAYIGPLEPGIFDALPQNVEHIYTKFPEERIRFRSAELGTGVQDGPAFENSIIEKGMKITDYAKDLLRNPDFKVVGEYQSVDLVEVSVGSLGFTGIVRYDAICARARELGLDLCPSEVGPQLRLHYTNQPLNEWLVVAMKPISDRGGLPNVFGVDRDGDGLWLGTNYGRPENQWNPNIPFIFVRSRGSH